VLAIFAHGAGHMVETGAIKTTSEVQTTQAITMTERLAKTGRAAGTVEIEMGAFVVQLIQLFALVLIVLGAGALAYTLYRRLRRAHFLSGLFRARGWASR
jgi:hypothetical protein